MTSSGVGGIVLPSHWEGVKMAVISRMLADDIAASERVGLALPWRVVLGASRVLRAVERRLPDPERAGGERDWCAPSIMAMAHGGIGLP